MQTETIKLQFMAHGGLALGRDSKGQIVFVPGGIPGERVRVAITQQGKRREGPDLTIEQVARERVPSRCAHFGVCGGCQLQHIEYGAQLRFKMQMNSPISWNVGKLKKYRFGRLFPIPSRTITAPISPSVQPMTVDWAYGRPASAGLFPSTTVISSFPNCANCFTTSIST